MKHVRPVHPRTRVGGKLSEQRQALVTFLQQQASRKFCRQIANSYLTAVDSGFKPPKQHIYLVIGGIVVSEPCFRDKARCFGRILHGRDTRPGVTKTGMWHLNSKFENKTNYSKVRALPTKAFNTKQCVPVCLCCRIFFVSHFGSNPMFQIQLVFKSSDHGRQKNKVLNT